ncbi:MAG TPA: DoxX family protein [Xanthobacteraceae bacterium]|jgi:putative oxidoreductase
MDASASLAGSDSTSWRGGLTRLAPYALSLLRIIAALLFIQHGTSKFFGFPSAGMAAPTLFDLEWFAALIEFGGGILLTFGLFTRAVALIMSGEMAVGYFMFHAPHSFFPYINHGELAIMFCFVFFYLIFAGPGPISLDALIWGKARKT